MSAPAHPERNLDQWTAQWAVQALARWSLTVAVALGLLIVIGGPRRFSSPTYEAALRYPYAPESWGVVLGLFGLLGLLASILGRFRLTAVGLLGMSAWCVFFGFSIFHTAQQNPNSGTTGVPVYAFAAVVTGVLAVVHWKSARGRTS